MLNHILTIARKEITDSGRDRRAITSAVFHALLGPFAVGLVAVAYHQGAASDGSPVLALIAVFTIVAAFVGGMNVAMDTVAGERERRSLLPLLLNPVSRIHVTIGKWLGVACFSMTGLGVNAFGFGLVFEVAGLQLHTSTPTLALATVLGLVPLALLAAALQLLISTVCRSVKEAQTYLSMLLFLPMGLGMLLAFFPAVADGWGTALPLAGQFLQLETLLRGTHFLWFQASRLAVWTLALTALTLWTAAHQMQRDAIVFES